VKVFVDTEFTSLDRRFQQLISVGMVDEAGERELYLEVRDFLWSHTTEFVRKVVIPLLGRTGAPTVTGAEVGPYVREWLRSLGEPVTLVVDSTVDIRIVAGLSRAPGVSGAVLLEADRGEACAAWIDRYFAAHPDRSRHHALEDARALRLAYRATNEDGERPLNLSTL
jgi:hypothetical protein